MAICHKINVMTSYPILYIRAYSGTLPEGYTATTAGDPQWQSDSSIRVNTKKIVFEPDGGTIALSLIFRNYHQGGLFANSNPKAS